MGHAAPADMAVVLETSPVPQLPRSPVTEYESKDALPEITVVFTSIRTTPPALRKAGVLARKLDVRITLVVTQIVPYPLPLAEPPVLLEFIQERVSTLASDTHVEATVRICLCRDRFDALTEVLKPESFVVIGGRRRWWLTADMRLARRLRRAGYEVVFVETE